MGILFNKKATIYKYTRDSNTKISSYTPGSVFACNIQPVGVNDWFEQATVYKYKKLYTNYANLKVGDKIVVDSRSYIIKEIEDRQGTKRTFYKVFISESEGE